MSETPLLTSIDEMLETAQLQLADIRFDHMSIDLVENAPQAGSDLEGSEATPIEINCMLGTRHEGKRFGTRFEFQFKATQWQAVIAVITYYEGCQEFALAPEVPADFASRVALMAAFPYVREALSDLTTRVTGTAVVLPLLRPGQIVFTLNE